MQNTLTPRSRRRRTPRVGLVLGAGGLLGSAWTAGVLPLLAERLDRPLGDLDLDLVLGTSAAPAPPPLAGRTTAA